MCLSDETRKAIARWMDENGIKRIRLAEQLGMSRSQLTNVLNGNDACSMDMADRIVDALGCRIRVRLEHKK